MRFNLPLKQISTVFAIGFAARTLIEPSVLPLIGMTLWASGLYVWEFFSRQSAERRFLKRIQQDEKDIADLKKFKADVALGAAFRPRQ